MTGGGPPRSVERTDEARISGLTDEARVAERTDEDPTAEWTDGERQAVRDGGGPSRVGRRSRGPTTGTVGVVNLGLRFLLELAALGALAYWALTTQQGTLRVTLALGLPLLAAALWTTFRVAGDGGTPPVAVSGAVRLGLEFLLFGTAVGLLSRVDLVAAAVLGAVVVVHYLLARDRVYWLLTVERRPTH